MSDQPPSHGDGGGPPRIALPKNIAQTLRYLNDFDLDALHSAVERLRRRRPDKRTEMDGAADAAPAEGPPARRAIPMPATKQGRSTLPVGKASLITASARSGMKPQAIARALRLPLAEVNRVLKNEAKPKG